MSARRVLLLDANRLSAYHWRHDGVRREERFTPDDAGLAAFEIYLREHGSSLFYLLADVTDENFQLEEVPFVRGRDRTNLIKRKLAQYYYGTPLSTAIPQGRMPDGRRDERILFSGLTGYAQFEPWLAILTDVGSQLVGVFAAPMILASAAARQVRTTEQALLISVTRAGLRQTFFDHGHLRFSRLTPVGMESVDEVAATCAAETEKIVQYLAGQRLIARNTRLPTLILAHPADFEAIGARCRNTEKAAFEFLDLQALRRQHRLNDPSERSLTETLLVHTLVQQTPREQFAPPATRRFYRLWQARSVLLSMAFIILAGCLLFALGEAIQLNSLKERQDALQAQIAITQRQYDSILQTLPRLPISNDELRAVTTQTDLLARRNPGLMPALQQLSRGLTQAPKVELTALQWRLANRPDIGNDANNNLAAETGDGNFIVLDIQARLPLAMVGDHRAQLDTINGLVDALKADNTKVHIISLPFETESGKLLKSDGAAAARVDPPRFALRLVQTL